MNEITVKGCVYQIGKIDAIKQFHLARRLGPLLASAGITIMALRAGLDVELMDFVPVLGPVADVLAKMTDEETNYILFTCLGAVSRAQTVGIDVRYAPVTSGGRLMFDDIDMPAMIRLAVEVLKVNLGNFLTGLGEGASSQSS